MRSFGYVPDIKDGDIQAPLRGSELQRSESKVREPPPRAVALRTRGSQFDFALNSRERRRPGAVLLLLMPAAAPIGEAELLKCLEMLRLKPPTSRSKSPRTQSEPPKTRSGTPKTGSKSPNSRAARGFVRNPDKAGEHAGEPRTNAARTGYSFPSIGQGLAERHTGALRGAALRA